MNIPSLWIVHRQHEQPLTQNGLLQSHPQQTIKVDENQKVPYYTRHDPTPHISSAIKSNQSSQFKHTGISSFFSRTPSNETRFRGVSGAFLFPIWSNKRWAPFWRCNPRAPPTVWDTSALDDLSSAIVGSIVLGRGFGASRLVSTIRFVGKALESRNKIARAL